MGEGFQELGLSSALVEEVARLGYRRPTAIQRAAIPVLRRGGNVVIHAAGGAGATAAYGLGLADRLQESAGSTSVQALVITATEERAAVVAREITRLARPVGVRAIVLAPAWQGHAAVVVVPATRVLTLVQASTLKLDDLKALVIDGLSAILSLGGESMLETLLPTVPRDAQRVIVTSALTPAIEKLGEAHARRALHVPGRPAVPEEAPQAGEPAATIEYRVVAGADALQAVAAAVAARDETPTLFARHDAQRTLLQDELALRGLSADVQLYWDAPAGAKRAVGYGVPFDAESLAAAFAKGGTIIVDARELAHLRLIARQANFALKAAPTPPLDGTGVRPFLDSLRRAMRDEDIEAQLLVIAPLLEEYSAAEVAAAASALLRKRAPTATAAPASGAAPAQVTGAFVKLFISIGQRDNVSPREIVGAITGEAGVKGDQVGRVDIRDTFSIVEVAAEAAERVIRALNGTSLRGRSLRVDYDRRTGGQRRALPSRSSRPAP